MTSSIVFAVNDYVLQQKYMYSAVTFDIISTKKFHWHKEFGFKHECMHSAMCQFCSQLLVQSCAAIWWGVLPFVVHDNLCVLWQAVFHSILLTELLHSSCACSQPAAYVQLAVHVSSIV